MTGPLEGVRICDCTQAIVGPFGTRMLAEMGADVVKVESPAGDRINDRPPTQGGIPIAYLYYNMGKKAIVLDLWNKDDHALMQELIRESDVFVHNWRLGVAERLKLDFDNVSRINPRIIYAHATAWGTEGPMKYEPATDTMVQAFSGWVSLNGARGGTPEFSRFHGLLDESTGAFLAGGIIQALFRREFTGRGQIVFVSLLGSALAIQTTQVAKFSAGQRSLLNGSACTFTVPHEAFLCEDRKYIAVGVLHDRHWIGLCKALNMPHLATDARFATNDNRVRNQEDLRSLLGQVFKAKPTTWWCIKLTKEEVPNGTFHDWEGIRDHVHTWQNGYLRHVLMPHLGHMYLVGVPWKFSETPSREVLPVCPGQHSAEVIGQLRNKIKSGTFQEGQSLGPTSDLQKMRVRKPLARIKVVDLTQGLTGPYTCRLLADVGADVIKVEGPDGDYSRQMQPRLAESEESAIFGALNYNKSKIVLDLNRPDGLQTLMNLIEKADIFVEDLETGVADRLGIGYDAMRQRNPGLIYCAITAFGEEGPLAGHPGSELVIQAMTDWTRTLGSLDKEPERIGADIACLTTGNLAFNCILAALFYRCRSGKGQRIGISMYGSLIYHRGLLWAVRSEPEDWKGIYCDCYTSPPDYGYRTKDGRVYFYLTRSSEEDYYKLVMALGLDHVLEDPRFLESAGRLVVGIGDYAAEVKPIWERVFQGLTTAELTVIANQHGAQVIPVNDYETMLNHPQVKAIRAIKEIRYGKTGTIKVVVSPWKLTECK